MSLEAELQKAISDFLCSECKSPWYTLLGTKDDFCFNSACSIHDRTRQFPDVATAEPLATEMKQNENALVRNLQKWKKRKLLEFAYQARLAETSGLWKSARVKIANIMLLDEFLCRIEAAQGGTQSPSLRDFRRLLDEMVEFRKLETMIEDIEFGRFLISKNGETFILKYWTTVFEMFRSFGLINEESREIEGTFRYQDIDVEAKEKLQRTVFDFGAYFERLFDFSSTLRYGFEIYNTDRIRHDYNPTTVEMAALLALAYSSTKPVNIWPSGGLEHHLANNRYDGIDASQFIQKYASGRGPAPIIVQFEGKTMFDWFTILFYSHYLIAKNEVRSPQATGTGADSIREAKGRASRVFDNRIRLYLANKGYKTSDEPLTVKYGETGKEYDVVGCHEEKKLIVIVEAKYRDLTTSSFSKERLVNQELLGRDGVLQWAVNQQERLDLMPKNPARFNEKLNFKSVFGDYQRKAFVVTKFVPIIKKYKEVEVLSYPQFAQLSTI